MQAAQQYPTIRKTSPVVSIVGVLMTIAIFGVVVYFMMSHGGGESALGHLVKAKAATELMDVGAETGPTSYGRSASSSLSASAAVIKSDLGASPAQVRTQAKPQADPRGQSTVIEQIKQATKGDGSLRPVKLNGEEVPRETVELAMFENQDFMPRSEFPAPPEVPNLEDQTALPQKSMFGPMTYPLVWQGGVLGMDVGGTTKATSSFEGGVPPANAARVV